MDICRLESAVRREAIRRRVPDERRLDISRDLGRSTSWFDKHWAPFRRNPNADFTDRLRAPRTSPH